MLMCLIKELSSSEVRCVVRLKTVKIVDNWKKPKSESCWRLEKVVDENNSSQNRPFWDELFSSTTFNGLATTLKEARKVVDGVVDGVVALTGRAWRLSDYIGCSTNFANVSSTGLFPFPRSPLQWWSSRDRLAMSPNELSFFFRLLSIQSSLNTNGKISCELVISKYVWSMKLIK